MLQHGDTGVWNVIHDVQPRPRRLTREEISMLRIALALLAVAILAAMFGFGVVTTASVTVAKVLFAGFAAGFLIMLVVGLSTRRRLSL